MLRFLYTICDLISGLLAIASPVAIFHWLFKLTGVKAMAPVVILLNPVFEPLDTLLNFFIQLPVLHYNGQTIPTTQGGLACLMTIGFFIFNFSSEYLKTTEQCLDVAHQANLQKRRLKQLKSEQQQLQKQITTDRKVYAVIQYDFKGCPSGAASLETSYNKHGGKLVESGPHMLALEFETVERAFKYSLEAGQNIQNYYATLRPMDPQPPYQIAIQGIEAKTPKSEAVLQTTRIVSYAGKNQTLFGSEIQALMSEQGILQRFHFESVGMYAIHGKQVELFRLRYEKRERAAF